LAAEAEVQQQKGSYKTNAITVSLIYDSHSELEQAYFKAIEDGVLH